MDVVLHSANINSRHYKHKHKKIHTDYKHKHKEIHTEILVLAVVITQIQKMTMNYRQFHVLVTPKAHINDH